MSNEIIPRKIDSFEIVELSDGIIVQHNDLMHTLNITAADVFNLCDGKRSVEEIINEMRSFYPDEDIEKTIKDFLEELENSGLICI